MSITCYNSIEKSGRRVNAPGSANTCHGGINMGSIPSARAVFNTAPDSSKPLGLCWCGCGKPTRPEGRSNARLGIVKGQPCRYLRGHSPTAPRIPMSSFWDRVVKQEDGCWLWTGNTSRGYGSVTLEQYHTSAHRLSYLLTYGTPVPEGKEIHHTCGVRRCVNPDHMEVVTRKEHKRLSPNDITTKLAQKTECVRGHPFTPENIYLYKGRRHCRACRRYKPKDRAPAVVVYGGK